MTLSHSSIKHIHAEASTHCNARCPGCPRSIRGYMPEGFLKLEHLTIDTWKKTLEKFPNVERVQFNGNLGDPMMNPDILELVKMANCKVTVTTNGSIGNRKTFEALAEIGTQIAFSIDGLEDTNHLYRQDVEWSKLMQRVKWFLDKGGEASWKFVPFKHNIHQLDEIKALAKKMGFTDFYVTHHNRNWFPALDKQGNVSHWILPHDKDVGPHKDYDPKKEIRMMQEDASMAPLGIPMEIDCEHLTDKSVYISADGFVSPCCFHGLNVVNRRRKSLKEFAKLRFSWDYKICDPICATSCGKGPKKKKLK